MLVMTVGAGIAVPAVAQSFLDRLNHARQELEQATQAVRAAGNAAGHAAPAPGAKPGQNCGALGAGCLNYMDTVTDCMSPLKGYHARMWADVIDERLKSGTSLGAAQRQNLEEDLTAYRAAQAAKTDTVDARISGRMFEDLPQADQVEVNRRYGVYYNQIMGQCNGADHMQVGHTTKMDYLKGAGPARAGSVLP